MKDSLLHLLTFLFVFLVIAAVSWVTYSISLMLIPGGTGLVFSNPLAGALLPSLVGALIIVQYRSVLVPGRFVVTWFLLGTTFFLIITLSIPLIEQMPPVRTTDTSPLVPGRFLPLEKGALLLSYPKDENQSSTVLIPSDQQSMLISPLTQYDSLNRRFVFSTTDPMFISSVSPERQYFQFPKPIEDLGIDFLSVYRALQESSKTDIPVFFALSGAITMLFMGLYVFFSWRTWLFVQVIVVILLARLSFSFLVYAFWSVPNIVDVWISGTLGSWLRIWAPILFVFLVAMMLFFMTWLTKPHRRAERL